ncbi:Blp family class II bacteriocin [Terracidiphilus gabretensis]|jgi:ABC-type microcin C transport system permease subunit YejE|uniref:Blp family class II bacteriocin n=1 Tax=Terracidiphilus gabretensis TaxID=1577687 RepID=UPI00071BAD9B|nr:Blp family class II bacteriocin [Terracidiphilus gabretensis]
MSAATQITRRDLEAHLIEKSWKDPEFKRQVVSDPKGMFEKHLGQKLPEKLKIFIHEEDANTLYFSIPPAPSNLNELSDEDLEKVAGGTDIFATLIVAAQIGITLAMGATVGATVGAAAGSLIGTAVGNDSIW